MIYVKLAIFLPLFSALLSAVFALRDNKKTLNLLSSILVAIAALASLELFKEIIIDKGFYDIQLLEWIRVGDFSVDWGIKLDQLSVTMIVVVNLVSAIVHFYSLGYMSDQKRVNRFMSYLSLFTFFMLVLVTSSNLIQLFVGWEGVGLCSYLLIGYWYKKESANVAAFKAFIANRVGDFAFLIGLMGIYILFGSFYFDDILPNVLAHKDTTFSIFNFQVNYIDFICVMLFIGCMGKSAQLGLHVWLPDAMEGPTPVSALIHAATMVTAGIFLVVRCSALFELSEIALQMMTIIGALTCIFAATIAITQNDIKKVIAYSTCSQLGYMFFACGVSAYAAGMFHLVTHAFFKALLFLCAGNIIVAAAHEQDLRKMGGLWKKIPATYLLVWIGSLAIAGIPPFSGYFSKDMILEVAYMADSKYGLFAFILGLTAAFLTSFYSWRLLYLVFHGESKVKHFHKVPQIMTMPLYILALGAIFVGYYGYNFFHVVSENSEYWGDTITVMAEPNILALAHDIPPLIKYLPLIISLLGILFATIFYKYKKDLPRATVNNFYKIYKLFLNKWYFDEIYQKYIIRPFVIIAGCFYKIFDQKIIDGAGPNGAAFVARKLSRIVSLSQTGHVYHYAFSFILGIITLLTWLIFKNI